MKIMRFERDPERVNLCIIVDVYDWAWDIAAKEMLEASGRINGIIYSCEDFVRQNPDMDMFDLVLFYPWGNTRVRKRLEECPEKVMIGVAGGDQITEDRLKAYDVHCGMFPMIAANNEIIQRIFKRRYPDKEVFILSHGVDTDLFRPEPRKHDGFVIGWVGNHVRPLKRFVMAEEIAQEVGAELKVATYDAKIPHDRMPEFYNSIDALLITSTAEAHPMIVYEAMSCGVPVVTTNVGDVADTIADGENGFILPLDAPPEAFIATLKTLKAGKLRKEVGTQARATILKRWPWNKIVKQYNHLERFIWTPEQLEKVFLKGTTKLKLGLPAFRMRNTLLSDHEGLYKYLKPTFDMYEAGEDMTRTPYIEFGKDKVRNKEYFYNCKRMADVPKRQAEVLELYDLFKEHGYSLQESIKFDKAHNKTTFPTCVYFTDEGHVKIYDGMHRQCIMEYLGIDTEVFCGISVAGGGDFPIEQRLIDINSGRNCYEPKTDPRLKDWHVWRKDSERRLDTILGYIVEGTVLDVGASEGWFSHELTKRYYECSAIEIDMRRLAIARYLGLRQNLDIIYHNIDYKKFLEEPCHFDNIILLSVIHHEGLKAGNRGIARAFRVLRGRCDRAFIEMPLSAKDISWTGADKKEAFDFTMDSIQTVMEQESGMRVLDVWRNGIRPMFILGSE